VRISIVVPAFNEERLLPSTLQAIRESAQAFPDWELIVCDNNSTDRTAEIARAAGAKVVFEPKNQISRARNTGAAAASGDWLLFIDADSSPSRELFQDVLFEIEGNTCLAGGCTIAIDNPRLDVQLVVRLWNLTSRAMRWAAGTFVFCETAAFREAGGFSEELYATEELELFGRLKRLARAGGRRIVILHRHPLRTSDRKVKLYSPGEHVAFLFSLVARPQRTLRSAKACHAWYDGRR
jgi:glycosyltransferase involved in cell wall biosynthesis